MLRRHPCFREIDARPAHRAIRRDAGGTTVPDDAVVRRRRLPQRGRRGPRPFLRAARRRLLETRLQARSWLVALANPNHYYFEIMLPGSLLGAVVGFATQRFGRPAARV